MVKVWGIGHAGPNLAHSVELLDLALALRVDDVLVGQRIPKEWRQKWDMDYVILVNGLTFAGEHDRGTENIHRQIAGRMKKLADCPFDVLWTCPDEQRMDELIGAAPNDRHWFTTFDQATTPHEPVWENRTGAVSQVPVQLDVQ